MKTVLKIIKSFVIILICLFFLYIIEECIRLRINDNSKPLWIIDRTKYCVTCIRPGEELDVDYWSIGYIVKVNYYLDDQSTEDNKIIKINNKEFFLFNKIKIWGWSK